MFSVSVPSWCSLAAMPLSAMKRNALPCFRAWAASWRVFALKKPSCAFFASELSLKLS